MGRIYRPRVRHRLGKQGIDSFSFIQTLIKEVRNLAGTFRLTGSTSGTPIGIDIAGFLFESSGKVSFLAGNLQNPRHGVHFDVGMAA